MRVLVDTFRSAHGIPARYTPEDTRKARNMTVLSARVQSGRRAEQTRRKEYTANIDGTTTRPSSHLDTDIGEEKKKGSERGPIDVLDRAVELSLTTVKPDS